MADRGLAPSLRRAPMAEFEPMPGWIDRACKGCERLSRVRHGQIDWEIQVRVPQCDTDVNGDFIQRVANDCALSFGVCR